ncbi:hypothetical protein PFISCL1PPCAC_1386, partial [Pristionchus fissidentatus]
FVWSGWGLPQRRQRRRTTTTMEIMRRGEKMKKNSFCVRRTFRLATLPFSSEISSSKYSKSRSCL